MTNYISWTINQRFRHTSNSTKNMNTVISNETSNKETYVQQNKCIKLIFFWTKTQKFIVNFSYSMKWRIDLVTAVIKTLSNVSTILNLTLTINSYVDAHTTPITVFLRAFAMHYSLASIKTAHALSIALIASTCVVCESHFATQHVHVYDVCHIYSPTFSRTEFFTE